MEGVKLFDTTSKYFLRQKKDIAQYGKKKKVKRFGVSFALLQEITPRRRLSKKPIRLSEPRYFIEQYEQKNPQIEKYYIGWNELSDQKKIDYIVKERYSELIINKLMNYKIKNLPVENDYSLNMDGEIVSLDKGDDVSVNLKRYRAWLFNAIKTGLLEEDMLSSRSVHNHPTDWQGVPEYILKYHSNDIDKIGSSFSDKDIANCYGYAKSSYVVDAMNHKYKYTPFRKYCIKIPFILKVKEFLLKQHEIVFKKKTNIEKELSRLVNENHSNDDKENLAKRILEGLHKMFTQDSKNLYAKTDCLYALSDFGKYEQIK